MAAQGKVLVDKFPHLSRASDFWFGALLILSYGCDRADVRFGMTWKTASNETAVAPAQSR
jgi:hypothetical protein